MTEDQGVTEPDTRAEQAEPRAPEAYWSVEGWEAPGDGGLSDTVVRIPKITDDMLPPAPTHHDEVPATIPEPVEGSRPATIPEPVEGSGFEASTSSATVGTIPEPVEGSGFGASTSSATVPPPAVVPPVAAAVAAAPRPPKPAVRARKARLRISRIDPWSVMKTSFLFSIAFGIMFWVGTWLLWTVVVQSGLFDAINSAMMNIVQNPGNTSAWRIEDYINTNKVLGIAALVAVINVVISTALGTLFAFLYNLAANVLGGLEVTLAED